MCGIAGKINLGESNSVKKSDIKKMVSAIAHRGPDDEGIETFENVGLGHRRLSIIDLSKKGHQPMSYLRGRYYIVFNGEIYNFMELKSNLIRKGYKFTSKTDTEVILALYDLYGNKMVSRLRGMFSFAIYDRKKEVLFAARDRLGQKPFKYFFDGSVFIFASELKAILTQPEVSKKTDLKSLGLYMYWGYIPSPATGFKNIFKLPAAHYLELKGKQLTVKKYWDLSFGSKAIDYESSLGKLQSKLDESVKLRMIADVPVGAFLSGGIDSTIIVGLMARHAKHKINTYTVGFSGWDNDESAIAKQTADFFNTQHTQITIDPKISKVIDDVATAYEEPFGDVSAIPSYYINKEAKKHITVVLNGDGGDENFIGYSNYTTFLDTKKYLALSPLFAILHKIMSASGSNYFRDDAFGQRLLRTSDILGRSKWSSYLSYNRGYLNYFDAKKMYRKNLANSIDEFSSIVSGLTTSDINKILYFDLNSTLPDSLMTKMDIASMQFGVETRSPFLDHELVQLAASFPTNFKYRDGNTKVILRDAFKDLIPEHVLNLPKRGFVIPIADWLKEKDGVRLLKELAVSNNKVYKILNHDTIEQMIHMHLNGVQDYSNHLWRAIMLQKWLSLYNFIL